MPALHSMGAFDYSAGASAAPSRTEINRRVDRVESPSHAASAGGSSHVSGERKPGSLQRKTPLLQRKAYFDSAEYFMAKEQGYATLPVGLPRPEPSRRSSPGQPSRLSISSH